jgi:hypothetical protein
MVSVLSPYLDQYQCLRPVVSPYYVRRSPTDRSQISPITQHDRSIDGYLEAHCVAVARYPDRTNPRRSLNDGD